MDEHELRDRLAAFGLSEKEVDMYFVVLEHGEAKTSVIADESGVSQRYVYNIAEQLEDRGLVDVHDHVVPTTVHAVPPEEAVSTLVGRLRSVVPGLEQRFTAADGDSATFEVFKSRQTVLKRITELVSGAEHETFVAVPTSVTSHVADALANALDRGVSVLLLEANVEEPATDAVCDRFEGVASVVRQWGEDMPFVVTADTHAGIVGERNLLVGSHDDRQAVSIRQTQLVDSMFGSYVSSFWPMGTEVYVTDPDPLPGTHTMFRAGVLQATLHHREGTDLWARARAVPTDGGEYREVAGPVVDVRQGLVEPTTNSFPVENSLVVDVPGEGEVRIGGQGAFVEDYRADSLTLERA